jgi:polygalacturonase
MYDRGSPTGRRRGFLQGWLAGGLLLPGAAMASASGSGKQAVPGLFNARDFGATGGGHQLDTRAIQTAIDACAASGGGVLYLPPGKYLSGTIFLKSNVSLVLETGAVLLGSANRGDYPSVQPGLRSYTDVYVHQSLIYGENLDRVAILGHGVIDGQGVQFHGPFRTRPYIIRLVNCTNVEVADVHLKDSPMWVQHYLACSDVHLHGLTVRSTCNANNDGIDIDACERVLISDCNIVSGDDSIVLKSTTSRSCRDVTVTNCILSSRCNAFKLGTESVGGFQNITFSNCAVYDTGLSGIALESVDGGILEHVNVSGITMRNVKSAIFLRLGNRARPAYDGAPQPGIGALRSVSITQVQAHGADKVGCAIAGLPEHPIEDVTLQDVRIRFAGGGMKSDASREAPEADSAYPEYNIFGTLPAFGFYCRHVRGLRFNQVQVSRETPDDRPALVCDDLDGLMVSGFESPSSDPLLVLRNTRRALLYANRSPEGNRVYLHAEGRGTRNIQLASNDLIDCDMPVERGPGLRRDAVLISAAPTAP